MRICFLIDNLYPYAGWGRLASKIANNIKTKGYAIGFITREGNFSDPTLVVQLRNFSVIKFYNFLRTLFRIRTFVKNYDVIVCYDVMPYGVILNIATIGLRKKIVINALGTYSLFTNKSFFKDILISWVYNRASGVFVVSEFLKKQIEKYGFVLEKYTIVPVGVETKIFYHLEEAPKNVKPPYIISVGAVKHRKGYHNSIKAFSLITKEFPNLKYVIVGDQSIDLYCQNIRNLVKELKLEEKVIFLSKVSDFELVKLYSSSELFILTPITAPNAVEGFGMVYLEAGACGKPVIGTCGTGAEAAIIENKNGLLVSNNPADIALALKKILSDKNFAYLLGINGMERAKEFDWAVVADIYIKNLKELLFQ